MIVNCDAAPAIVVMVPLVPVVPPVDALTVALVPAVAFVWSVTVARPVPSVVDGLPTIVPVPLAMAQTTELPAVATLLPLASASCAVIVTLAPAAGDVVVAVTIYCDPVADAVPTI